MTTGAANAPVPMGSYDLSANNSINIRFVNCRQTNDINDRKFWGIFASNYCKNLLFEKCTLSRFDAHMGVCNATIRNCELGYMGIHAIGSGTFTIENSTVYANEFLQLRPDYGSTWDGEFIVRNCSFVPGNASGKTRGYLITGRNNGMHNFGYECTMPRRIIFDGVKIDDSACAPGKPGPFIFGNFNNHKRDESHQEKFPYRITEEVILKNVTTKSGKQVAICPNLFMFKDIKIIRQ